VDARTGAEAGAVVFLALAGGRIGAIPGSLPVLAGWAATGMPIDVVALALTGVPFMWQIPHFLAIGWMARDDYATAGCPMLSVVETTERASARISLTYAAAMVRDRNFIRHSRHLGKGRIRTDPYAGPVKGLCGSGQTAS
jgi:hypothetical protein